MPYVYWGREVNFEKEKVLRLDKKKMMWRLFREAILAKAITDY